MTRDLHALETLSWSPALAQALEGAAIAIGRLDARYSASFVAVAWKRRAAWTGYARALQLQGVEIDEIDVFSWGCGLPLAGRQRRTSTMDDYEGFARWQARLDSGAPTDWRDRIGFTASSPDDVASWPAVLRALDVCRQATRRDPTIAAWLWLPELLRSFGMAGSALPCLVEGSRAFRQRANPTGEDWRAVLRWLARAARGGLDRLDAIEAHHRQALAALAAERRPGALTSVLALAALRPLFSPQFVADQLGLSLPGAGKVLARAAELGLLVEVSGRRAWRQYLVPDLAVYFGLIPAARGRPAKPEPVDMESADLAPILSAFDEDMRAFDLALSKLGVVPGNGT